jgi:hypothetical protein
LSIFLSSSSADRPDCFVFSFVYQDFDERAWQQQFASVARRSPHEITSRILGDIGTSGSRRVLLAPSKVNPAAFNRRHSVGWRHLNPADEDTLNGGREVFHEPGDSGSSRDLDRHDVDYRVPSAVPRH